MVWIKRVQSMNLILPQREWILLLGANYYANDRFIIYIFVKKNKQNTLIYSKQSIIKPIYSLQINNNIVAPMNTYWLTQVFYICLFYARINSILVVNPRQKGYWSRSQLLHQLKHRDSHACFFKYVKFWLLPEKPWQSLPISLATTGSVTSSVFTDCWQNLHTSGINVPLHVSKIIERETNIVLTSNNLLYCCKFHYLII